MLTLVINFNAPVNFTGSIFTDSVDFAGSTFNGSANFDGSTFDGSATFIDSIFNAPVNFGGSTFNDSANFLWTTFNAPTYFGTSYDIFSYDAAFFNVYDNIFAVEEGTSFRGPAKFGDATFNYPAFFCESVFYDLADFSGSTFNDSVDFTGAFLNDTAGVQGPDNFKSIITDDERTCNLFRIYYKNRVQLLDAYNIYYDYRNRVLAEKNWNDLSKWFDILCLVTCGYGLKPDYSLGLGIWIIGVFAFIYKTGPKIIFKNNEKLFSSFSVTNIVFDSDLVKWPDSSIPKIPRFDWQGPIIYRLPRFSYRKFSRNLVGCFVF